MIYTVTLNPAIDYMVFVDELKAGNILRSKSEKTFFGGKGINVSQILKELDVPSAATGFLAGFTGRAIADGIACKEIKSDFVELSEGLTRINVKIRSGEETDINTSGPKISEDDLNRLFEKLDMLKNGDFLVLAGSVPSSMPPDTYERIMERLYDRGISFVVDAEGDLLINSLKYKPFLIKPNCEELAEIFKTEVSSPEKALSLAARLKGMGAQNVIVSMGEKGAVLLDSNGKEHFAPAAEGKFINSVGAGDSMVAGFIKSSDFSYALKLGAAAGSATAFSEGLANADLIYSLM